MARLIFKKLTATEKRSVRAGTVIDDILKRDNHTQGQFCVFPVRPDRKCKEPIPELQQ